MQSNPLFGDSWYVLVHSTFIYNRPWNEHFKTKFVQSQAMGRIMFPIHCSCVLYKYAVYQGVVCNCLAC